MSLASRILEDNFYSPWPWPRGLCPWPWPWPRGLYPPWPWPRG